jgi:hypothetical protein
MTEPDFPNHAETEGLPPFVKTWHQMYTIIIGTLILMIALFYAFMIHFQ